MISSTLLLAAALTAAFFGFLWDRKRLSNLNWWTSAWTALTLHYATPFFFALLLPRLHASHWESFLSLWLLAGAIVLFLGAVRQQSGRGASPGLLLGFFLAMAIWIAGYESGWIPVSSYLGMAGLQFEVARLAWNDSRRRESTCLRLLAMTFVLWGLVLIGTMFRASMAGIVRQEIRLVVLLPQVLVALLLLLDLYEEEKRRVERNMLALSNLSLAATHVSSGELPGVLEQALDRVLSVVHLTTGALLVRTGDGELPLLVSAGLQEQSCQAARDKNVCEALNRQVARLGGLLMFPAVADRVSWDALSGEPAFPRLRELLEQEGLRQAIGISLQAKEEVYGLLLLASRGQRKFAPGELRLLLALGHQIGSAVENSQYLRHSSRRDEDLNILTEIGQALSSTLDSEALLDKISREVNRLFKGEDFYIALHDNARNDLQFIVEVEKGRRLPRRARPAGNHLSEYIIREKTPVLIREDYVQQVRRMGIEPLRHSGSFCGVPLVIYDRAFGVMAVISDKERVFDEAHLELLRVLAGEAAIAIENARLFSEERKKAQHLTLLNNVSRHAITTLNPDEMLANIVHEMGQSVTYGYVGIGLLDYATKDVVIHAVGGRCPTAGQARGRRIPLGEGLVGHVARSGQVIVVQKAGPERLKLLLEDSQSGIALPIVYADQLMGVLYCESILPGSFSQEETLLLQTLADFVAGALHNAQSFQRAQEQAITDGLTGMKTHRFFMEALSSEWKRATRAGRPFSLVMMDLDRFKYVNDFFGHLEGDSVLQRVAQMLEQNCRRSDVVARYGGDEFVVLMPETTLEQAHAIAAKLRACIAADAPLHEKNITGSFGLAGFPAHGSTPQELIQVADASMYMSKHQGGNAVSLPEAAVQPDPGEAKKWKRDVLEAYLGVALKRLFSTGPEAFQEIRHRLEQFMHGLVRPAGSGGTLSADEQDMPAIVIEMLTSLALAIDAKDPFTQGHSRKVSAYAVILAQGLDLPESQVEQIRLAGLLHDIGKVGIPESILNKAGPLDADEWEIMRTHAALGAQLLSSLEKFVPAVALQEIVRHHHEYFDGSGYPDRVARAAIPLGARIVAIADAYDTILSDRTYKKGRSMEDALAELERCVGVQFDPGLVRVFVDSARARIASAGNGHDGQGLRTPAMDSRDRAKQAAPEPREA